MATGMNGLIYLIYLLGDLSHTSCLCASFLRSTKMALDIVIHNPFKLK